MDVNRVIGEVAARHGVRLDPDDPALVLVTVAEIMLAEAREEFLVAARRATAELLDAARGVEANTAVQQSGALRSEANGASGFRWTLRRFAKRLGYGAVVFASGFLVGRL